MQQLTSLKIIGSTGSVLDPSRDLPVAAQHLTALRSLSYTGRVLALPSTGFDLQPGMLPPTLQVCVSVCLSKKCVSVCVEVAHATKVQPPQPAMTAPDTPTRSKPTAAAPCCVCACGRPCCLGSKVRMCQPLLFTARHNRHIVNVCMCGCLSVSFCACSGCLSAALCLPPGSHTCGAAVTV